MKSAVLWAVLAFCLGCVGTGNARLPGHESEPLELVLAQWDSDKADAAGPVTEETRKLAEMLQQAYVERGGTFHPLEQPTSVGRTYYLLVDQPVVVPPGSSIPVAKDLEELAAIAREKKEDIYYTSLTTKGSLSHDGKAGAVVAWESFVVDWQRAEWESLSAEEKAKRGQPEFRMWLYGSWGEWFVTRDRNKLIVYEPKTIIVS